MFNYLTDSNTSTESMILLAEFIQNIKSNNKEESWRGKVHNIKELYDDAIDKTAKDIDKTIIKINTIYSLVELLYNNNKNTIQLIVDVCHDIFSDDKNDDIDIETYVNICSIIYFIRSDQLTLDNIDSKIDKAIEITKNNDNILSILLSRVALNILIHSYANDINSKIKSSINFFVTKLKNITPEDEELLIKLIGTI